MILLLAGTSEGKSLAEDLVQAGYQVLASTHTSYGAWLTSAAGPSDIRYGPLCQNSLTDIIKRNEISAIIDATHPFATLISSIAKEVADLNQIPLIRYSRSETPISSNPLVQIAATWNEAVEKAKRLRPNIFLTIGTKNLDLFVSGLDGLNIRLITRVLPLNESISKCLALGIPPKDIIAMQGPFSKELNMAIIKSYEITGVISKDSGLEGGTEEKIAACIESKVPLILIKRPGDSGNAFRSNRDVIRRLQEFAIN